MPKKKKQSLGSKLLDEALEMEREVHFSKAKSLFNEAFKAGSVESEVDVCFWSVLGQARVYGYEGELTSVLEKTALAAELASQNQLHELECEARLQLATRLMNFLEFSDASDETKRILKISREQGLPETELSALLLLQAIELRRGDLASSTMFMRTAQQLFEAATLSQRKPELCIAHGLLFKEKRDFTKAIECLEESAASAERLKQNNMLVVSMREQGAIYRSLGDEGKAIECEEKLSSKVPDRKNVPSFELHPHESAMSTLLPAVDPEWLDWYLLTLGRYRNLGEDKRFPMLYVHLAEILIYKKRYLEAKEMLWNAVDIVITRVSDLWYMISHVIDRLSWCYASLEMEKSSETLSKIADYIRRVFSKSAGHSPANPDQINQLCNELPKNLNSLRYDGDRYILWKNIVIDKADGYVTIGKMSKVNKLGDEQVAIASYLYKHMGRPVPVVEIAKCLDPSRKDDESSDILVKFHIKILRRKTRPDMFPNVRPKKYYIPKQ